jgi:hypothetical protein
VNFSGTRITVVFPLFHFGRKVVDERAITDTHVTPVQFCAQAFCYTGEVKAVKVQGNPRQRPRLLIGGCPVLPDFRW